MINEIYIDNYKCLVNFRISPARVQLWLGDNGVGKTTVTEILDKVQRIVGGASVSDAFSGKSLTCWNHKDIQEVSLKIAIDQELYEYEFAVEYDRVNTKCRLKREKLKWQGHDFYFFDGRDVHLYRLQGDAPTEGASFPADWNRSHISSIAERRDNGPLISFRRHIEKWLIIQPIPVMMKQSAESESADLSRHAENFAEWYRHIKQENDAIVFEAYKSIREALPGFVSLNLKESGDARKLSATFNIAEKDREFDFVDLSDGQRQLIFLYMTVEALNRGQISTLIIDEPDNFISLREIKPLLGSIEDACTESSRQAIVISHHPEIIDEWGHGEEIWFSRRDGGHTVIKPYPKIPGLSPAEVMARGWDD